MSQQLLRPLVVLALSCLTLPALAANIAGRVLGAGAPVAKASVSLWAASAGEPRLLAQAKTDPQGHFSLSAPPSGKDQFLYLVARGGGSNADKSGDDNAALALMAVLGAKPPANVTLNELTTVASVW